MEQQHTVFAAITASALLALGTVLFLNGLASGGLALVGLLLLGISGAGWWQNRMQRTLQPVPVSRHSSLRGDPQ